MADLFIDMAALGRTERTLSDIGTRLTGPAQAMGAVPEDVSGHAGLQGRLRSFAGTWEHGIAELSELSGAAASALTTIRQTFVELDAQLAASLSSEES
ncbi:hypothetical protein [Georgenia sp. SUBG003]|uniref:hypothetical protein n=1 Tax=Georgenia sp. SUBG003 TaxID=1497974 RepID=UPI0004D74164|nr:hypothetical protein DA06_19650 [Georgenia sp. SUBG003]